MAASTTQNSNRNKIKLNRYGVKGIIKGFIGILVMLVVLLVSAGRINWINAYVYIGLYFVYLIVYAAVLIRVNPELLNARGRFLWKNTKTFDRVFFALWRPFGFLTLIIAGLDSPRYEWSTMAPEWVVSGVILFILSLIFATWAMAVNKHFEVTVRIQHDRNHRVCTSGPYKIVRHPGYVGAILGVLTTPLILSSWWALAPSSAVALLFVFRTAMEDRTLRNELPGYKEYAKQTRYRLLPLVW